MAARHGGEIGVAHLDRHAAREQVLFPERGRDAVREPLEFGAHLAQVVEILRIGGLAGDRFPRPVRLYRPRVVAVRQARKPLRQAADGARERDAVGNAHLDESFDADGAQLACRDRSDAPERLDRKLLQETLDALGCDHRQAVGFAPARGDLGQELVRRHARRAAQGGFVADARLEPQRHVARKRLAPQVLGDVQVSLVERQRFHQRRGRAQDRHHLL